MLRRPRNNTVVSVLDAQRQAAHAGQNEEGKNALDAHTVEIHENYIESLLEN